MAAITGVKQIVGSVLLAVLAQPIHEFGHALALRVWTGVWPRIGVLSVQPHASVDTKAVALTVLAAGDFAVLLWWASVFLWVRRHHQRQWAIIGMSFILFVVLIEWLSAAVMFPFGHANLGGTDATKFLSITRLSPWAAAAAVSIPLILIGTAIGVLLRHCLVRNWWHARQMH